MNRKLSFKLIFLACLATVIVIGGLVWLIASVVWPRVRDFPAIANMRPNTTVVDFHTHFGLNPEIPQLVFDGRRMRYEEPPLVEYFRGEPFVYLHAGFLRDFIDPFVFWDERAGVLFISTLYEMLEFTPGSDTVLLNGSPRVIDSPVIQSGGEIFVPICVIQMLYPLIVDYMPDYNMVVVTSAGQPQTTAVTSSSRTNVRYWPGNRSPITQQLEAGAKLTLFIGEEYDYSDVGDMTVAEDFIRVRTPYGLLGYVHVSEIENIETNVPLDFMRGDTLLNGGLIDNFAHHSRVWHGNSPINVTWDSVSNAGGNDSRMQFPLHPSLTAVMPTWFEIDETGMFLTSIASRAYVDWAHSQGVYVWPKVFDFNNARARAFLKNRDARKHAINQLIQYVETFNLDGLNIDFEHLLLADEGPYKIQFLRELAIPMRQRGVVLSAAVKVPYPHTAFYRRDLIGKTVDFVMVMAYDQHWAGSPVAGPNASLPWVRRAVSNMLDEVPHDRLVLGLPFYNRIWREVVRTGEVSHYAAWNTYRTRNFFNERNAVWEWDFDYASYIGEAFATEYGETVVYRVWLEDARSIQEKINLFYDNDLAGVASWSRALAIDEFWDVLALHFFEMPSAQMGS
ncbi:MAG: glycosyl hydrolase family 18 protein [Defluviitaleaceae bacterium]|nr:glycosyl hydrolase family 18 protein [Defluviitaleaceae bacterium]